MPTQSIQENIILTEEKEPEVSYKVGQLLKTTREAKQISLEDACKSLKIRKFFLENIEKGNFEKLPGTVYTLGFIKSYSLYLGVDFEELSSELAKLTTSLEKDVPLATYCLPQPKNLLTKNALWGSVALTAVCIGIYFTYFGEREEVFEKAAPIEKRADPAREKIEIIRQMPVEKSLAVGADQLIPGSEVITISANKETWIRVVDANNQLIVARLLRPQSFYRLNTEAGFRLTAGEAGALNIYLGEERLSVPSLSGEGLLENFPIDRRSLSEYAIKPVSQEIPLQQPEGLEQPEVLSLEKKPEATLFSLQKEAISKSE